MTRARRYDLGLLQCHMVTSRSWLLVSGQLHVLVRTGEFVASGCVNLLLRLELLLPGSLLHRQDLVAQSPDSYRLALRLLKPGRLYRFRAVGGLTD